MTKLSLRMGDYLGLSVFVPAGSYRFFPKNMTITRQSLGKTGLCSEILSFSLSSLLRLENQKLKELVTGGTTVLSTASASETETPEAKDELVKEESPAVRPKMEATTPQKVHLYCYTAQIITMVLLLFLRLAVSYFQLNKPFQYVCSVTSSFVCSCNHGFLWN